MDCLYCKQTFSFRGMSNHLNACRVKRQRECIEQVTTQCTIKNLERRLEENDQIQKLNNKIDLLQTSIDIIDLEVSTVKDKIEAVQTSVDDIKEMIAKELTIFDVIESEIRRFIASGFTDWNELKESADKYLPYLLMIENKHQKNIYPEIQQKFLGIRQLAITNGLLQE